MSLAPGAVVDLDVEKAASGGRMIARHAGQVVLVAGAIPGERVSVRIDRVEKRLAFGSTIEVLERSPDRRDVAFDPACGGCAYSHAAYPRQLALKGEIIADAFARIGRMPLEAPVRVAPSREDGYRMRARLQVRAGRAGFFREGTHELCDAASTGQLLPASLDAVHAALAALGAAGADVTGIDLSENIAADERAMHLELASSGTPSRVVLEGAVAAAGLTGCSSRSSSGVFAQAGDPKVGDPLALLTGDAAAAGQLRRHAASFFQGNRYLITELVGRVMRAVPASGAVLDLYAGVGLFSVALAAAGRDGLVAIEGDRESGADLLRNAAPYKDRLRAVVGLVEDHLRAGRAGAGTVIVDPPRVGLSREAMARLPHLGAARIIYVSCDPPTLARDARALVDAGYVLASIEGFDLFPNTPHIEALALFTKRGQSPLG